MARPVDLKKIPAAYDSLLKDFSDAMESLSRGATLVINGSKRIVHGYLLFCVADTPAAQRLAGFKEGVGGATHPCRTCNTSRDQLSQYHIHESCPLRSKEQHQEQLMLLQSCSTDKDHATFSKAYGVNGKTLYDIPYFDVTKCVLHDPRHILLEGVVKMELKHFCHMKLMKETYI